MGWFIEVVDPTDSFRGNTIEARRALGNPLSISNSRDLDDFTITVRVIPVDLAGNRGAVSPNFVVRDNSGGCTVGKRARFEIAVPILLALLWVRRRRYAG